MMLEIDSGKKCRPLELYVQIEVKNIYNCNRKDIDCYYRTLFLSYDWLIELKIYLQGRSI